MNIILSWTAATVVIPIRTRLTIWGHFVIRLFLKPQWKPKQCSCIFCFIFLKNFFILFHSQILFLDFSIFPEFFYFSHSLKKVPRENECLAISDNVYQIGIVSVWSSSQRNFWPETKRPTLSSDWHLQVHIFPRASFIYIYILLYIYIYTYIYYKNKNFIRKKGKIWKMTEKCGKMQEKCGELPEKT